MTEVREQLLTKIGFRFGINGPHAARTMMLDDLRMLLAHTTAGASRTDYAVAIVADNVLGKSTKKARELAKVVACRAGVHAGMTDHELTPHVVNSFIVAAHATDTAQFQEGLAAMRNLTSKDLQEVALKAIGEFQTDTDQDLNTLAKA